MQLEELQQQWQRLDAKIERTSKLQSEILRLAVTRPARRRVHRLSFWPALDVALSAVALVALGSFLTHQWQTVSLVVPASILWIAAFLLLSDSIRQLILVSEINWDGAVVDIQSSLSRLRMIQVRQFKWLILASPLVWFCALIVVLQSLLPAPLNIVDKLNRPWVEANYVFGVLFLLLGEAVIRSLANRFQFHGSWQYVVDGISGTSLNQARAELERWSNLEHAIATEAS